MLIAMGNRIAMLVNRAAAGRPGNRPTAPPVPPRGPRGTIDDHKHPGRFSPRLSRSDRETGRSCGGCFPPPYHDGKQYLRCPPSRRTPNAPATENVGGLPCRRRALETVPSRISPDDVPQISPGLTGAPGSQFHLHLAPRPALPTSLLTAPLDTAFKTAHASTRRVFRGPQR